MLVDNGGIYAGNNNAGDVNVQIGQNRADNRQKDGNSATQIAVLEKEVEMLREQLAFVKSLLNAPKE